MSPASELSKRDYPRLSPIGAKPATAGRLSITPECSGHCQKRPLNLQISGTPRRNLRGDGMLGLPLLAEGVEEVGTDRFCATIVPIG